MLPSHLADNVIALLQQRYIGCATTHVVAPFDDVRTGDIGFWAGFFVAHHFSAGVKARALALDVVDDVEEVRSLARLAPELCHRLDEDFTVLRSPEDQSASPSSSANMVVAPTILLYAREVRLGFDAIVAAFDEFGLAVEIIDESRLFVSAFISYGGPDEAQASAINAFLNARGVRTWFYPKDAPAGGKQHRVMHDGVNSHDRFLLICSEASLNRRGVLNEIERVLEREAREGGSEVLLPVTLDDYVYERWQPARLDVATQVRDRVTIKIQNPLALDLANTAQLERVVSALRRRG